MERIPDKARTHTGTKVIKSSYISDIPCIDKYLCREPNNRAGSEMWERTRASPYRLVSVVANNELRLLCVQYLPFFLVVALALQPPPPSIARWIKMSSTACCKYQKRRTRSSATRTGPHKKGAALFSRKRCRHSHAHIIYTCLSKSLSLSLYVHSPVWRVIRWRCGSG